MRELAELHSAAEKYERVLDEADRLADAYSASTITPVDPWLEIERRLPLLLSTLTPEARAVLRDHCETTRQMAEALTGVFGVAPRLAVVAN